MMNDIKIIVIKFLQSTSKLMKIPVFYNISLMELYSHIQ